MAYTPVPIRRAMEAVKSILEDGMPAKLSAAGLPAISSFTFADVLVNEENQLPQVVIDLNYKRHSRTAGGGFQGMYKLMVVCALEWTGNEDGYLDGAEMASIAEALMFDNAQYEDGTGELWNAIPNKLCECGAAGNDGADEKVAWQGGRCVMTLVGKRLVYG